MLSVDDVAAAVVSHKSPLKPRRLHELVSLSQAWSLVIFGEPLFADAVELRSQGPVVEHLSRQIRSGRSVATWRTGDSRKVTGQPAELIAFVCEFHGDAAMHEFSDRSNAKLWWGKPEWPAADPLRGSEISNEQMILLVQRAVPAGRSALDLALDWFRQSGEVVHGSVREELEQIRAGYKGSPKQHPADTPIVGYGQREHPGPEDMVGVIRTRTRGPR